MDKFTASNGVEITIKHEEVETYLLGKGGQIKGGDRHWTVATANQDGIDALREFFRAEDDERLGRWRWPDKTEYVVYPSALYRYPANPDRVMVVNEQNGQSHRADRDDSDGLFGYFSEAGHAYFATHPEPKPWLDAKPWEAWVLTVDGDEWAVTLDEDRDFRDRAAARSTSWMHITDERITAATRLYPKEEA